MHVWRDAENWCHYCYSKSWHIWAHNNDPMGRSFNSWGMINLPGFNRNSSLHYPLHYPLQITGMWGKNIVVIDDPTRQPVVIDWLLVSVKKFKNVIHSLESHGLDKKIILSFVYDNHFLSGLLSITKCSETCTEREPCRIWKGIWKGEVDFRCCRTIAIMMRSYYVFCTTKKGLKM